MESARATELLTPVVGDVRSRSSVVTWRYVTGIVLIAACYFVVGKWGNTLQLTGPAGAFWPPAGLGIAVLYVGGLRWWPAVLLGDTAIRSDGVVGLWVGLGETVGNMSRALVAVLILLRLVGPRAAMDRLEHVGAVAV